MYINKSLVASLALEATNTNPVQVMATSRAHLEARDAVVTSMVSIAEDPLVTVTQVVGTTDVVTDMVIAAESPVVTVTQVVGTTDVVTDVVTAAESPVVTVTQVTVTPATVTDVVIATGKPVVTVTQDMSTTAVVTVAGHPTVTKTTITASEPKTTVIIHHIAKIIASKAVSQMAPLPKSTDVCKDKKNQNNPDLPNDKNDSENSDNSSGSNVNCTALATGDNWQFVPCDTTCSHNLAKIIPSVIIPTTGVGAGLWPTIHRLRKYWKTEDGSRIQRQLLDSWDRYIKNRFSDIVPKDHESSMERVLKNMKLKMKTPQIPELDDHPLPDSPPGVDSPDGGIPTPKESPEFTETEAEWMEPYVYDEILRGRLPVPEAIVLEFPKYLDDRGFEIEEELDPIERAREMAWANDAYQSITKVCAGPKLCDFWKELAPKRGNLEIAQDAVKIARFNLKLAEQRSMDVGEYEKMLEITVENLKKVEEEYKKKPAEPAPSPAPAPEPAPAPAPAPEQDSPEVKDAKDEKKQAGESHEFQTISLETVSASTGSTEYSSTSHSSTQHTTTSATPTTMSTTTRPVSKSKAWTGVPTASPTGVSGYVDFDHDNFIIYGKNYAKTAKQAKDLFKKLNKCSKIDGWQFVSGDAVTGIEKARGWDFYATGKVKHENEECIAKAIKAARGPKVEWGVNGMKDDHPTDGHLFEMEMEIED